MIITLDMKSSVPIYVQLRNSVVLGIGKGELSLGQCLPTVRQMAEDIGINAMTVNKAYAMLKADGYIVIDRRHGAAVSTDISASNDFRAKTQNELELLACETAISGISKSEFIALCASAFDAINIKQNEAALI